MPDQIDANGLQVKSYLEIVGDLVTQFQTIYGADVNIDSNSPDGQMIGIFAQVGTDMRELLVALNNTFNVETAFGVLLDERVALNGLARRAGTNTITDITVTTTGAVNLVGLDALVTDPTAVVFTVADGDGNQYELQVSTSIVSSGDHVLSFQAKDVGEIQPVQNTITNIITIVNSVTNVNNPASPLSIGTNEETDVELKIRHARSFFLASTGPADSIEAALRAIPDVTDALVAENDTNSPVDGVNPYGIWAIVTGGTDAEVGTAIYSKKAPGCAMTGAASYVVTRPNGTTFTALFDRSVEEDLYVQFTITPRFTGISFSAAEMKTNLVATLSYKLNQAASIGDIILAMATIEPNGILSAVGVSSDGVTYADILRPSDFKHVFALTTARVDITIV